ncbi:MAG: helix-turn-helix domain-containing protein [Anaerolineae bacterium]|nr:helix-turn-helix domain-containing protein [Anaerolineae bacterium]
MAESFRDLLLRYRARTGLTQRDLAARLGAGRRTIQGWEAGLNHPSAERLQALIRVLLEAGGLTAGREAVEAEELWAAALLETPRMQTPFDPVWLDRLLAERTASPPAPPLPQEAIPTLPGVISPVVGSGERGQDWGEAPDVRGFVGRSEELARLRGWVLAEGCRLVTVLGMGGIGKTSLAARLAQEVAPRFERVYWRSLRDAPLPGEWLAGAIGFLSDQQVVPPPADAERLTALLGLLRARRCLLVLDNYETLFEPGQQEERYRAGLAGYGRLLQAIGEASHQSCLVLTSREAPAELAVLGSEAVHTFPLGGLGVDEARRVLAPKQLVGSSEQWAELTGRFGGNGLALKLVGERIRELFGGEIGLFLEETGAGSVFGSIRQLLAEQVGRSSTPEQQVLRVLAVAREPVRLPDLLAALSLRAGRGAVLEAVEALRRRSLVERAEAGGAVAFTLQSVVLEYVTDRLVEEVTEEIIRGQPVRLVEQALIQAQAREYVRQSQERLIGVPILQRLRARQDQAGAEQRLLALLAGWRGRPAAEQGYGPGNGVNLLRLLRGELRRLDLSRLAIRQAYLAEVEVQDARLVDTHLAETVLAEAFGFPGSVALSGDGALLAAGTSTGQVWLWRVADRTLLATLEGHTGQVIAVVLAANGGLLASGGADGTVRLWETNTRRLLATLEGHTGGVWGVALSADGELVASGSQDGTVRLWETSTGRPLATLPGHIGGAWNVALSADGRLVVSGDGGGMVRLWETPSGRPLATLQGHTSAVWGIALSLDGHLLASGDLDETVRLWEAPSGRPLATFRGHTGGVWNLALSADGELLAGSGADGTLRLWEVPSGRPLATFQGHIGGVRGVALSLDGHLLASGGLDGTVRLWETSTRRPLATLQGHTGGIWKVTLSGDGELVASSGGDGMVRLWETSTGRPLATLHSHTAEIRVVVLSADGHLLASGGLDGTVRLWETSTRRPLATLEGHTSPVWGVALSADGHLLASGGLDGMVRLWEAPGGRPLATLESHTSAVRGVALSADGHLLASGGLDGTVRLWETSTRRPLATLEGHTSPVWGVALSADGHLLASGGLDGTVRLWETSTRRPLATLEGHTSPVWGVAISADGHLVASGSADGTGRLWEAPSGRPLATLRGHTGPVPAVAFSADGHLLASGGWDGTIRLWQVSSGAPLRTLRAERRYERLDITGLTGITEAQRQALLALGAVEDEASAGPEQMAQR